MPEGPNKVVQSSRQVIERKLLTALNNPDTVAILASRQDLDVLIDHLEMGTDPRADELHAGLMQLRREAFGE